MKPRRILHEKTQRFLRSRWRTRGVYINKEQRFKVGWHLTPQAWPTLRHHLRMLHLHKWSMMHNDDVCCLWTHAWPMLCNVDVCCATLCWRLLHLHTWSMLRYVEVRSTCRHGQRCISLTSCICTHGRRYAMLTSLAHLVDAAQCWRLLHLQRWWLLRAVNVLFLHTS